MTETDARTGARLKDRPEYASKSRPLTGDAGSTVTDAVTKMSGKNYGCIIVTDAQDRVEGIVTERDLMTKLVSEGRDPKTTTLGEIMTPEPKVAREGDQILDWLRIMSNERFRRLPVVDEDGRIKTVFTQGDFVSYTWPDLLGQAGNLAKATVIGRFHYFLIGGGILIYALAMLTVLLAL